MNESLWLIATVLASQPYQIVIEQDNLSDGTVVFVLRHPELPGCKAEGETVAEAKHNLDDARTDYIYALLIMGLPVPSATSTQSTVLTSRFSASVAASGTWVMQVSRPERARESIFDPIDHGPRSLLIDSPSNLVTA